jgi:N-acetylmuramoyl-L-alanine amidase
VRRFVILFALVGLTACDSGGSGASTSPSVGSVPATQTPSSTAPTSASPRTSSSAARRTSTHPRVRVTPPSPSTSSPATQAAPPPVGGRPTVVLNPGHNGANGSHTAEINRLVPAGYGQQKACDTTGTNSNAGYPEHAFTWDVTLRARTILQNHGVRVVLTRWNDSGVGPCVDERAAIGNQAGVAAVVSIHADGAPSSGHGFHVNLASRTPDGATQATVRSSQRLGEDVHAALQKSSGLVPSTYIGKNGYFYRDDLAGLNLARKPATFLELGNMRNAGDAALLSSASGRGRIAAAVAAGILAYLGR